MTGLEFRDMHLRMRFVDRDQMVKAGIFTDDDFAGWAIFRHNPIDWFIFAPTRDADLFWTILEKDATK